MANTYEGNGDYSSYAEEESEYSKQRKMASSGPHNGDNSHSDLHHHNPNTNINPAENNYLNEKTNDYIRDCLNEKSRMDRKFPIAEKLLDAGKLFADLIICLSFSKMEMFVYASFKKLKRFKQQVDFLRENKNTQIFIEKNL